MAVQIARNSVAERSASASTLRDPLVGDLYSSEELPRREGFRVTVADSDVRWTRGEQELAPMTVILGVSALDELLGDTVDMLRAIGRDATEAGAVDTSLAQKLRHLQRHGHLTLSDDTVALHDVCVAIRNGVVHDGGRQGAARQAWDRTSQAARKVWEQAAGRPLPLSSDEDALVIDAYEILCVLKILDLVALEVNRQLRTQVTDEQWAQEVAHEYRQIAPRKAGDPQQNVSAVRRRAAQVWRLDLSTEAVRTVL